MKDLPAIFSTVAAFLSLATAVAVWWTHHRSLVESVRPVLAYRKWLERPNASGAESSVEILLGDLCNIGRGPALTIQVAGGDSQSNMHVMQTIPAVGAGDRQVGTATLKFPPDPEGTLGERPMFVQITCRDCRARRYMMVYRFGIRAIGGEFDEQPDASRTLVRCGSTDTSRLGLKCRRWLHGRRLIGRFVAENTPWPKNVR